MTSSHKEAIFRLELLDSETDAEFLARARKALRSTDGASCIAVTGSFAGRIDDAVAFGDWIKLLVEVPVPLLSVASGEIGLRGLAILLVCDQAITGADATIADDWRDLPGLAALAHRRLGPQGARRLLFGPGQSPIAALIDAGLAQQADTPEERVLEIAADLGSPARSRRHKRVLRAASEMPFTDCLAFDLWFDRGTGENIA